MRLNNASTNNLAIYSGVKTNALGKFVKKYNLNVPELEKDVMKYRRIRLELASAVSGYEDNEIVQESKAIDSLDESRRATEFFDSKHGKIIYKLLKKNGKAFDRELVQQYLDKLENNDLKWARIMDHIASDLGLNYASYNTFGEQEGAMLDAIEKLYHQHLSPENEPTSSKSDAKADYIEGENGSNQTLKKRRYQITEGQLQKLFENIIEKDHKHFTIQSKQSHSIQENILDDTYTFEVYDGRLAKFLDFIKDNPNISVDKKKRDGHYYHVTLKNSGRFEAWNEIVTFYKSAIKI
jgi:hypothetical protein